MRPPSDLERPFLRIRVLESQTRVASAKQTKLRYDRCFTVRQLQMGVRESERHRHMQPRWNRVEACARRLNKERNMSYIDGLVVAVPTHNKAACEFRKL